MQPCNTFTPFGFYWNVMCITERRRKAANLGNPIQISHAKTAGSEMSMRFPLIEEL
jgi:hypothetical protein